MPPPPPAFGKDASLVLIGMRCAGKSSLASIAAKALRWKVIDEKLQFHKATGYSIGGYIAKYGVKAYCAREVLILREILEENPYQRIIVCSSSCVETQAGRELLRRHLDALPIVHILRDRDSLQSFLQAKWQGGGDVAKILRSQEPVYFACSNLTFFNLDDTSAGLGAAASEAGVQTPSPSSLDDDIFSAVISPSHRPSNRSLSLKRVEADFLRFLDSVYGPPSSSPRRKRVASDPDVFNYALQLPFKDLKHCGGFELESYTATADLLFVDTDKLLQGHKAGAREGLTWWEYLVNQLAFLRRHTNQPIVYHVSSSSYCPKTKAASTSATAIATDTDTMIIDPDLLSNSNSSSSSSSSSSPDYFELVQLGLRTGVEFITLDLTQEEDRLRAVITGQKAPRGHCVVIGWFHDADPTQTGGWTGDRRRSWYDKAVSIGCDMVHMTQPAMTPSDNESAQWFVQSIKGHGGPLLVSAYNTGRMGRPSQCFNKVLTLVVARHPKYVDDIDVDVDVDVDVDTTTTITITQAQAALFSSFALEPLKFGVMGACVQYSLAPVLHTSVYRAYGMPHEYSIHQTNTLDDSLAKLVHDDHFGGLGLSSPFKTTIIPQLSCMSTEARIIGAVNTILPIRRQGNGKGNGSAASSSSFEFEFEFESSLASQRNRGGEVLGLYGENTDWKAIRSCAVRYLSPANAITSLSTALVVGAGGMARAAVYAMIRAGMKNIYIYNRTHQHAIHLVNHFEQTTRCNDDDDDDDDVKDATTTTATTRLSTLENLSDPWPSNLRPPTIVVNCSPIPGDKITLAPPPAAAGPSPAVSIPDAWLTSPTGGVYLELAYNNITSSPELLRICAGDSSNGWIGVAGLEIFVEVASAQAELWTGRRAPKHAMMHDLRRHLKQMQMQGDVDVGASACQS